MAIEPQVLEQLRAALYAIALKRLRDADAAEDAAQEVLTRTLELERQGRVPTPRELIPIAHGIARHVCADVIRNRIRATRRAQLLSNNRPVAAFDALGPLIAEEERARVRAALTRLAPDDRELLRLSFYEDLAPAQLAARFGEPAERIAKRKSRALARLRRAFFGDARATAETNEEHAAGHEQRAAAICEILPDEQPLVPEVE